MSVYDLINRKSMAEWALKTGIDLMLLEENPELIYNAIYIIDNIFLYVRETYIEKTYGIVSLWIALKLSDVEEHYNIRQDIDDYDIQKIYDLERMIFFTMSTNIPIITPGTYISIITEHFNYNNAILSSAWFYSQLGVTYIHNSQKDLYAMKVIAVACIRLSRVHHDEISLINLYKVTLPDLIISHETNPIYTKKRHVLRTIKKIYRIYKKIVINSKHTLYNEVMLFNYQEKFNLKLEYV